MSIASRFVCFDLVLGLAFGLGWFGLLWFGFIWLWLSFCFALVWWVVLFFGGDGCGGWYCRSGDDEVRFSGLVSVLIWVSGFCFV